MKSPILAPVLSAVAGRLQVLLAALLVAVLLAASPCPARDLGAARDCLEQLSAAVRESDATAFDRRVALEDIALEALREIERMARDKNIAPWMPAVLTFMAAQGALTNSMTSGFLTAEIREFVLYGVGSGAFAGHKVKSYQSSSMLAPLFEMASMGRKDVTWIGVPEQAGSSIRLPFAVKDWDNGNTYDIVGLFEVRGSTCRLAVVENMRDLILKILVESQNQGGTVLAPGPHGHPGA